MGLRHCCSQLIIRYPSEAISQRPSYSEEGYGQRYARVLSQSDYHRPLLRRLVDYNNKSRPRLVYFSTRSLVNQNQFQIRFRLISSGQVMFSFSAVIYWPGSGLRNKRSCARIGECSLPLHWSMLRDVEIHVKCRVQHLRAGLHALQMGQILGC